jgi:hypothetical protein
MAVLAEATANGKPYALVADPEWEQFTKLPMTAAHPLLRDLCQVTADLGTAHDGLPEAPLQAANLLDLPADERVAVLLNLLRFYASAVMALPAEDFIGDEANLLELGFSSFTALELSTRLRDIGITLQPTAVYDYPVLTALAEHICAELASSSANAGTAGTDGAGSGETRAEGVTDADPSRHISTSR